MSERARYIYRNEHCNKGPKAERVKAPNSENRRAFMKLVLGLMRERGLLRDGPLVAGEIVVYRTRMPDAEWACVVEAAQQMEAQA